NAFMFFCLRFAQSVRAAADTITGVVTLAPHLPSLGGAVPDVTAAAAVALVALGLFFFEHGRVAPPGAHYVPAQTKDGVFVPGHFE
ncbi:MAG: hypothetical protein J0I31_10490, partial [Rhizobiales bacterium]|nr:hypothetical protein [Hyphomicrobiales bacterium]